MVVLGIVSGVLALMTFFQNRLGKIFDVLRGEMQGLRDDMQASETRLNARIDEVKTDLKEDIEASESRI